MPKTPAGIIISWLLDDDCPPRFREEATYRARLAIKDNEPGDREHYLRELECWISYLANVGPHEHVDGHLRKLVDGVTQDQIEQADWLTVAAALSAAEATRGS